MSKPNESLPDRVMARLWTAMRGNYGARWDRMFPVPPVPPGVDAAQHALESIKSVQAIWAEKLSRFSSNLDAIAFALDNLPADPPNLPEFVTLCNRRPDPRPAALPPPELNKEAASAALIMAAQATNRFGDQLAPTRTLMKRELAGAGHGLTKFQREFWRKALKQEIWARYQIDTSQPFDLQALRAAVQESAHA